MRVRTHLRRLRLQSGLSLTDVCVRTGLARSDLSRLERGHELPRDDQAEALALVYGPPSGWYPPSVLRVLAVDLRACASCGEDLDPGARANRRRHENCPV